MEVYAQLDKWHVDLFRVTLCQPFDNIVAIRTEETLPRMLAEVCDSKWCSLSFLEVSDFD